VASPLETIRLRDSGDWVSKPYGHSAILNNSRHVPTKTDYCMPNEHIETPFTVLIPKREECENDTPGYAGALNFYTDGSKLDSRVGGGVYSHELHLNLSFRLPDHCSVFQVEVLAIKEAINKLRDYRTEETAKNINSDGQAALKSLLALTTKSSSVTNCRKSLNEIAEQFDVNLT